MRRLVTALLLALGILLIGCGSPVAPSVCTLSDPRAVLDTETRDTLAIVGTCRWGVAALPHTGHIVASTPQGVVQANA